VVELLVGSGTSAAVVDQEQRPGAVARAYQYGAVTVRSPTSSSLHASRSSRST
jgi:hypothetical protein